MAGTPDLFVVCKTCGAEVSPYITECPYCGSRLRKRAPKLDKGGVPKGAKGRRRRARPSSPRLSRLRPGEMPGIRTGGKPIATMALVLAAVVYNLLWRSGIEPTLLFLDGDASWRYISAPFLYVTTSYEVCALGAIFLFGWLLERRHGSWAPLVVFVLATAAGTGAVIATGRGDFGIGGNAAALGMLGAWVVRDLRAARHNEEFEGDLLGVAFIAVLLLALPAALYEPDPIAGIAGALAGLVIGHGFARLPEK